MNRRLMGLLLAACLGPATVASLAGVPVSTQPLPLVQFQEDSAADLNLNAYFEDPDGAPLSYAAETPEDSVSVRTWDTALFIGPQMNWNGDCTIFLVVTSKSGHTLGQRLQVRVLPVNDPPVKLDWQFSSIELPEDSALEVDIRKHFDDPDGILSRVEVEPGRLIAETAGLTLRLRGPENWSGRDSLVLRVYDDSGASSRFRVDVQVTPVNDPPVLSGMPPAGSIQMNGQYRVDFSGLATDVDGPIGGLVVVPDAVPGMRFRVTRSLLTVLPTFRIDTVTITGKLSDSAGGSANFSFKVFCNAGFRDNALNLWPNLDHGKPIRYEPTLLLNADASFDAISMTDSAVILNRYHSDGSQKSAPQVLRANHRDTINQLKVVREGTRYFLQLSSYQSLGHVYEIMAFDRDFRESAHLEFRPTDGTIRDIALDSTRKRLLISVLTLKDGIVNGLIETLDYSLQRQGSKRFQLWDPKVDTALPPPREPNAYQPIIGGVNLIVLPDRYAVFWTDYLRNAQYFNGIRYASMTPDLVQIDSGRTLDAHVDENPKLPLNDISYLKAYSRWGHVYLLWHNVEKGLLSPPSSNITSDPPTIRLVRLDGTLQKTSPIRKMSSDGQWYYGNDGVQFLANEVLVGWHHTDSYLSSPRGYYLTRFDPGLTSDSTSLLASDTISLSPKRHILNGRIYMTSRVRADGSLIASLADGKIPSRVWAREGGIPRVGDAAYGVSYRTASGLRFPMGRFTLYDSRGKVLAVYDLGEKGGEVPLPVTDGKTFGTFHAPMGKTMEILRF